MQHTRKVMLFVYDMNRKQDQRSRRYHSLISLSGASLILYRAQCNVGVIMGLLTAELCVFDDYDLGFGGYLHLMGALVCLLIGEHK